MFRHFSAILREVFKEEKYSNNFKWLMTMHIFVYAFVGLVSYTEIAIYVTDVQW